MSRKLPLFVKITSVVLLIILLHINTSFAQKTPTSTVAGEITYVARPVPTEITGVGGGVSFPNSPNKDVKGVSLLGATGIINCTTAAGNEIETGKYAYILYLDEESLKSTLTTNQRAKTASLKLVGRMRMWESKFIENDTDCGSKTEEIKGGPGGLEITMKNQIHVTPLNFIVSTARGRVYGPGFSDSVTIPSGRQPEKITSVDTGYLDKYLPKTNNQQQVLEALRKSGQPIPEGLEERLKQNQNISTNVPKHTLTGFMKSSTKDVSIGFHITSGFQADMLVYKPKAMASAGGGSAKLNNYERRNYFLSKNLFQKASFSANRKYSNTSENSPNKIQNAGNTNVFVPRQDRDKVQAFVNLDNDDKDDKYDDEDKEVKGGDNDLVKVVLRTKLTKSYTAQATLDISKESKSADSIKVYTKEDKSEEFKLGTKLSVTKDFIQSGGGFRQKTLWIEGVKPHTSPREVKFEFKFWETSDTSKEPPEKDEFDLTVIGVEKIEWRGDGNSFDHNDDLDEDINHRNPGDQFTNSNANLNGRTMPKKCGGKVTSTLTEPGAVRVFPGRRVKNGVVGKKVFDKVKAVVTLSVAPVAPINLYLRSFDVDDPSASKQHFQGRSVVDEEKTAEDNRGTTKANNSKAGYFVGKPTTQVVSHEFSNKEETLEFQVTMQPGDNFRIVAFGDKDFLENLENDDSQIHLEAGTEAVKNKAKQRIVDKHIYAKTNQDSTKSEIREAKKYAGETLSVWRRFFVEMDYMGEVTENKVTGTIGEIQRNTPQTGQTKIYLNVDLAKEYKRIVTNVSSFKYSDGITRGGFENAFQEGEIRIRGSRYDILYNSKDGGVLGVGGTHYVVVNNPVGNHSEDNDTFFLWDDDEKWGFKKGTKLRDTPIKGKSPAAITSPDYSPIENGDACTVAERYIPAYIVPDFTSLSPLNRDKEIDFVRNVYSKQLSASDDLYEIKKYYKFNYSEFDKSEDFWTIYMLYGYRGASYEDGDPDGGTSGNVITTNNKENSIEGLTDPDKTGIMIFLEGIIERNNGYQLYNGLTGEEDCVAHEIGHIFGAEHGDTGLMGDASGSQSSTVFSDASLDKIRSAKHP